MVHFWGGLIEVSPEWISPAWRADELIDRADVVAGLQFAQLEDVLAYKRSLKRPKDIKDIRTLEDLLNSDLQQDNATLAQPSQPPRYTGRLRRRSDLGATKPDTLGQSGAIDGSRGHPLVVPNYERVSAVQVAGRAGHYCEHQGLSISAEHMSIAGQ
jgi:hypothetical protein